jgi:hypothetical protein
MTPKGTRDFVDVDRPWPPPWRPAGTLPTTREDPKAGALLAMEGFDYKDGNLDHRGTTA